MGGLFFFPFFCLFVFFWGGPFCVGRGERGGERVVFSVFFGRGGLFFGGGEGVVVVLSIFSRRGVGGRFFHNSNYYYCYYYYYYCYYYDYYYVCVCLFVFPESIAKGSSVRRPWTIT